MAEESSTAAPKSSVLPNSEVDSSKAEPVASEASIMEKPTGEVEKKTEGKDTKAEMNDGDSKSNGDAVPATEPGESSAVATAAETSGGDTEMKDVDADDYKPASGDVQATPASTKKTPNGSTKKKSTGVPEHRAKKLNKKKSKQTLQLHAKPGEMYLARMKGHQPWPSIICDEDMLPSSLLNSRPVTAALSDGTFKRTDYAPGGKREGERTFPIMFLFTNEFAWLPNTELTPLTPEECKDAPDKGKSKGLIEAYKVAAEGHDLAYYKEILADHQAALEEDAERRREIEAKKAEKANKAKRKSAAAATDDDTMDVDEEGAETKPKTKKRKKSVADEEVEEKPAKTPKTSGTKIKLNVAKTPNTDSTTKAKKPKGKALKASATGSDEELNTPKTEEKVLTPAEAREIKEKEIRYYRHKLQRGFITRDYVPSDTEIKSMSTYLQKLEDYPELEGSIIRMTKINKVLKAMIRLPSIPKDEEYRFKKRSQDLLAKWNIILNSDTVDAEKDDKDDDAKEDDTAPKTNGVKEAGSTATGDKDKADETSKVDGGEKVLPKETEPSDTEGNKIGTSVEGEEEAEAEPAEPTKPSEEVKTDEPNVDKPAEAYQPTVETAEVTA